MPDQPHTRRPSISQSGIIPKPVLEPELRVEAADKARPVNLPEQRDLSGATTGTFPIVTEGLDATAERDDDRAARS